MSRWSAKRLIACYLNVIMSNQQSCPVCQSGSYQDLPYGGYAWQGKLFPLVRCLSCSLKYIKHNLTEEEINQLYQVEAYFDSEYAGGAQKQYWDNKLWAEQKARRALAQIKRFIPRGRVLDLGCAGGYLLTVAEQEFGYQAYGLELSQKMAQAARERGLKVATGTLAQKPSDWPSFDIIYLGDVLEHVATPYRLLAQIKEHLAPTGVVVLEVPLTYELTVTGFLVALYNLCRGRVGDSYFLPAQHRTKFMPKPPYHLLMFNPRSMRYLLNQAGFKVLSLRTWEGGPKDKFSFFLYRGVKWCSHYLTSIFPQSLLGDRLMVIAQIK